VPETFCIPIVGGTRLSRRERGVVTAMLCIAYIAFHLIQFVTD